MKPVRYLKTFDKQTEKLKPAQEKRLIKTIAQFQSEPHHPDLYNHPLTGQWAGYRSISFGGDWRAIYREIDGVAIFVACGTHAQLYK